ncbi:MAG: hypothetical protein ABSB59_40155 [Streptosporangiaceae bacterium]|jgi:hypothetical protein
MGQACCLLGIGECLAEDLLGPGDDDRVAAEVVAEQDGQRIVARRAGTNKNAIYRRWPSRVALGIAAYSQMAAADISPPDISPPDIGPPDTGSLRGDAPEMLRRPTAPGHRRAGRSARTVRGGRDPERQACRSHDADTPQARKDET